MTTRRRSGVLRPPEQAQAGLGLASVSRRHQRGPWAGVYALVGPASALWLGTRCGWPLSLPALARAPLLMRTHVLEACGRRIPRVPVHCSFGPRIGFVAGWLMLAADILAAAAVSLFRWLFGPFAGHSGLAERAGAVARSWRHCLCRRGGVRWACDRSYPYRGGGALVRHHDRSPSVAAGKPRTHH
jgi:hypothetical protein